MLFLFMLAGCCEESGEEQLSVIDGYEVLSTEACSVEEVDTAHNKISDRFHKGREVVLITASPLSRGRCGSAPGSSPGTQGHVAGPRCKARRV